MPMKRHSDFQYHYIVFPTLNLFFSRRTKIRKRMPPAQFDLAAPLQVWLRKLCAELEQCDPPGQLCAGAAQLPIRADAELVMQIAAGSLDQLIDCAEQAAERGGLAVFLARDGDGARIALFNLVADPSHRQWLLVALRTAVASRRPKQNVAVLPPRPNPLLFVISGPDGVGKTRLVETMKEILGGYPLGIRYFHPTTLVKDAEWMRWNAGRRGSTAPASEGRVSLARAAWRRFAPLVLRRAVGVLIGELNYARRVSQMIREEALANRIVIGDRYVYDRYVKIPLLRPERVRTWVAKLNCRQMMRPRLTFILSDGSEGIRERKAELSTKNIADYENKLIHTCARFGAPMRVLPIGSRTSEALVSEVIFLLLEAAGEELFAALDAGLMEDSKMTEPRVI